MKRLLMLVGALVALVIAVAAGYLIARHTAPSASTPSTAQRKVLYWYDPMNPGQHFDRPGKSTAMPGMQLKPKYADEAGGGDDGVRISPRVEQNLGLRTALVKVAALTFKLRVPGVLNWDQRHSVVVSARTDGVLTQLFVRAPFDRVHAGQPLAELLAPAWGAAAAEYGALADAQSADGRALRAAALRRLHVLGMSAEQIRQPTGAGGGIVLRAPADGVVSQLDVRAGQQVAAGTTLMRIDDPARLWLNAAIPQAEVAGIGAGTSAQIEVSARPGDTFSGSVEALLPEVDGRTRTQTARIAVDNPDGALAPGMFATVQLTVAAGKPHPLVPDEALISTGLQSRVILDLGNGRMAPRAVRIGRSADGYTEVLAGLRGGERVVTSGQFLIDSEANLDGALKRLTTPPASRSAVTPATPVVPVPSVPATPAHPSAKPSAHDTMPGMAMPASTGGRSS
ncbi:MAG TPA: efflux RND transporter periplasmic adaptor subunit [Rhodanobacter sp.]|nr:efflux RND transporter periplasmic adaptor subunit [Rhodanobacter sp.]